MKQLAEFFSKNKSVNFLTLEDCQANEFLPLFEALKTNVTIYFLSLKVALTQEAAAKLAEVLEMSKSIEHFTFNGSKIGNAINKLLDCAKRSEILKIIDIQDCKIGKQNASKLSELIEENKFIDIIDISYNNIEEGMVQVFGALKKNKRLRDFSCTSTIEKVCNTKFGVAEVIRENTSLVIFGIGGNRLGEKEFEEIFEALHYNSSLECIEIDIDQVSVGAIVSMIRTNTSLKTLNFGGSILLQEDMRNILQALTYNCSVTELFLGNAYPQEIKEQLSLNKKIEERDNRAKINMLILQRRRDGNILSKVPKRLLIYLFSFLKRLRIDKSKLSN